MLTEFILYLESQIGQPYLWGGQHTKLTPKNYVSVINRMESDPLNRSAAIAFCKKKFDAGATELYAYDCSGLGMYFLQNMKQIFKYDMSANTMMGHCEIVKEPKRGYWVFRLNDNGRAYHIGYMVSDTEVVHAKGRKYGVVKERYSKSYWNRIGKPKCFNFDPVPSEWYVKVIGGSVRVRTGGSVLFKAIGIAHRNEMYPLLGTADSGWYKIDFNGQEGYITNKPKYTEVVAYGE